MIINEYIKEEKDEQVFFLFFGDFNLYNVLFSRRNETTGEILDPEKRCGSTLTYAYFVSFIFLCRCIFSFFSHSFQFFFLFSSNFNYFYIFHPISIIFHHSIILFFSSFFTSYSIIFHFSFFIQFSCRLPIWNLSFIILQISTNRFLVKLTVYTVYTQLKKIKIN